MNTLLQHWSVVVGLALTAVSIIMNGYLVRTKEKRKIELELAIEKIERELSEGRYHQRLSELKANNADLFFLIIKAFNFNSTVIHSMNNVTRNLLSALIDKYIALHYKVPPQSFTDEWQSKFKQILESQAILEDYRKTTNDLMEQHVAKEQKLFDQKEQYRLEKAKIESSIDSIRYWAITLQIIALLFVAWKDLWT